MEIYGEKHIEWYAIDFDAMKANERRKQFPRRRRPAKKTEIWEFDDDKAAAENFVAQMKINYENPEYNIVAAFRYVEPFTIVSS